jgi:hypothetical protein
MQDKVPLGQVLSEYFGFPASSQFINRSTFSFVWAGTIDRTVAGVVHPKTWKKSALGLYRADSKLDSAPMQPHVSCLLHAVLLFDLYLDTKDGGVTLFRNVRLHRTT